VRFHVIGGEEVVTGFRFVGVEGSVAGTRDEASVAFDRITSRKDITVLILTEQVSALIPEKVTDWQFKGHYPLIVEIPGIEGHMRDRKSLVDSIRQAVGVHV
jgi:vacuolar-type H+-ATPase subunit F/Vma7